MSDTVKLKFFLSLIWFLFQSPLHFTKWLWITKTKPSLKVPIFWLLIISAQNKINSNMCLRQFYSTSKLLWLKSIGIAQLVAVWRWLVGDKLMKVTKLTRNGVKGVFDLKARQHYSVDIEIFWTADYVTIWKTNIFGKYF